MTEISITSQKSECLKRQMRPVAAIDDDWLHVLQSVPKEHFLPPNLRPFAYADMALRIDSRQLLSPCEEALMLSSLPLTAQDHILEIGTGAGYITALLARRAAYVDTIDIHERYTRSASQRLADIGITNVSCHHIDSWSQYNPNTRYHGIIIQGAVPKIEDIWLSQLAENGYIWAIVGKPGWMHGTLLQFDSTDHQTKYRTLFSGAYPYLEGFNPTQEFNF